MDSTFERTVGETHPGTPGVTEVDHVATDRRSRACWREFPASRGPARDRRSTAATRARYNRLAPVYDLMESLAERRYRPWRTRLWSLVSLVLILIISVLAAGLLSACGRVARSAREEPGNTATLGQEKVTHVDDVESLVVDPTNKNLLAAASDGLYRSADGGRSWWRLSVPPALASADFKEVVVNPDNPAVLYATGADFGVIRSDDGGQTWQQVTEGLPSLDVGALAIHSFRRETLFAWIKGQGVFRTEDGGQGWKRMDGGPAVDEVLGLAHSTLPGSMNTGWLYAATPQGAYVSMDCF